MTMNSAYVTTRMPSYQRKVEQIVIGDDVLASASKAASSTRLSAGSRRLDSRGWALPGATACLLPEETGRARRSATGIGTGGGLHVAFCAVRPVGHLRWRFRILHVTPGLAGCQDRCCGERRRG